MLWAQFFLYTVAVSGQVATPAVEREIGELVEAQRYQQAEQALLARLAQDPNWEAGRLLLARVYHQTGRAQAAREEALTVYRVRGSLESCLLLARIAMDMRELNESIGWLNKAAAQQGDQPEIYRLLGMVYALGGVRKEAAAAFFEAIRLAPANWEYHYLAGRALYDLERFPEARRELSMAIELNGASVRAWTALGQLQEKTQDMAGAEQSYRKAVTLCGNRSNECAWPLLELGRVLEIRMNATEAESCFARAAAARPEWAKPHYYLGKALAARERFSEARKALESAVKLDSAKPEYFYQLGQVCRHLGDEQAAKRYLIRFREIQDQQKNAPPMELEQP